MSGAILWRLLNHTHNLAGTARAATSTSEGYARRTSIQRLISVAMISTRRRDFSGARGSGDANYSESGALRGLK